MIEVATEIHGDSVWNLIHRCRTVLLDQGIRHPRALTLYQRRGYREAGQVFFPRRTLPFICFELDLKY